MATEILGHTVGATANELAIHSMEVMDKFSSADDLRYAKRWKGCLSWDAR